jgi:molecular chaperone HscB
MSHPDHFALFALPARFALDEAALEQAYKGVQSRVHPDRFASGSAAERRVAMQWAARANEAYRTLKSPHARAAYLCERAGVSIEAGSNTAMPPAFLMQQMEWREALDEARTQADTVRLAALTQSIDAERARLLAELESAIDTRADFAAAAGLVRSLMFVDKFCEELRMAAQALPHQASA